MTPHILRLASLWITAGFVFLTVGTAFAQTTENKKSHTTLTNQSAASKGYVKGITAGRARALVGAFVGLISLIVGWRAKARSSKVSSNSRGAMVALSLGVISTILNALHLWASAGAMFGSGSGKAGAIFGIVLSLVGITLGALALRKKKMEENLL